MKTATRFRFVKASEKSKLGLLDCKPSCLFALALAGSGNFTLRVHDCLGL